MRVFLVYGLGKDDFTHADPFVKKIFYDKQDAEEYAKKSILNGSLDSWCIEEMEVE